MFLVTHISVFCITPGSKIHHYLSALQQLLNRFWLMGLQSWSKLEMSAGQHPSMINPVARHVPWEWLCAALLQVHSFQDWAGFSSQQCVVTCAYSSTLRAHTSISAHLPGITKNYGVPVEFQWAFHAISQVLKNFRTSLGFFSVPVLKRHRHTQGSEMKGHEDG